MISIVSAVATQSVPSAILTPALCSSLIGGSCSYVCSEDGVTTTFTLLFFSSFISCRVKYIQWAAKNLWENAPLFANNLAGVLFFRRAASYSLLVCETCMWTRHFLRPASLIISARNL